MSWHVASYTGSIGATANTDLPADPSDGVLTILNNHYVLRQQMMLRSTYAIGGLLTRARFDSPTLRFYGSPYIRPVRNGALPASNDNYDFSYQHPVILPVGEEIAIQVSNSGAGPTRTSAFLCLQDVPAPVPPGNVYKVRFTSTTTATADAWSNLAYTFDSGLPSGGYSLVGSELFSTNAIWHRWFLYPSIWRPGYPCVATEASRLNDRWYQFPYGEMGRFINTAPPVLQVWADGADASFIGYMYLIPVAPTSVVTGPIGQPIINTSGPGGFPTIVTS